MTLQDWLRHSSLVAHRTSAQEIRGLLEVARRDLADSQVKGLSLDASFNLAYNSMLQVALAALAASGHRIARGVSHHHFAIQSLAHTIGCDAGLIDKLDRFRKKRNISDYEQAGTVSEQEAATMVALARDLGGRVAEWLRQKHPELLEA